MTIDTISTRREFLQAATAFGIGLGMQNRSYQLKSAAAGRVLEAPDGRAALTYLTSKPEGSNLRANSACCFHPVTSPSGERITDLAPGDHVHHRGIFLAWHSMEFRRKGDFTKLGPLGPTHGSDISRADFWGWGEFAPTDQRVIQNRSVAMNNATDKSADLLIENDWTIRGDRYMAEKTTATWREAGDANVLDLAYALTPDWDLTINQQPFGGFCVRARNDGESWYESRSGKVLLPDPHYSVADLNWPAAEWYAYGITLKSGKTLGCAVIDHPSNPRSTWHNPRYVWMINPCIMSDKPFTVARGRTLSLRYRVVVFDGPVPVARIRQLSSEWRG